MDRRRLALLAVVGLALLGGCSLPESPDQFDTDREFGYVGDYAYDDEFAFDDDEALTEAELEAVKYRSMARIEVLRELKFEHDVELEVITREAYREGRGDPGSASAFTNEVWRAAFVVDGETDVNQARDDLRGGAVLGYYSNDRIVIVTDDADEIRVDRTVLVHELVHALQDQQFGLDRDGERIDERRAELGLIEGEANYVPHLYDQRCGEAWQCLDEYDQPVDSPGVDGFNVGLFLSIYAPYAEGPSFVEALSERGGWAAVDDAHANHPASTSQVLHPDRYPDDEPIDLQVPDRSSDDWEPITAEGEPRTETVGEATLFGSLWVNGVVDRPLDEGATALSPYNYTHPATTGWTGDSVRVYQDDEDRTGHVWRLAWEDEREAERFADAYRTLLENRGGEPVEEPDAYRIPDDDPFAGAYRVTVAGDTVEIVGAPSVAALAEIHAAEPIEPTAAAGTVGPAAATDPNPAASRADG